MSQPTQRAGAAATAIVRTAVLRRVLLVVLGLNIVVMVTKNVIAIRTGALTVLGATLESGLDVLGSLMGILLVTVATRAPNDDHPYGHANSRRWGRSASLASFRSPALSCCEKGSRRWFRARRRERYPPPISSLWD